MGQTPNNLKLIPLAEVYLGHRYREPENYDLKDLVESIKHMGLIQPIAVLDVSELPKEFDISKGQPYVLLAGGRRFTTFRVLSKNAENQKYGDWSMIPANIFTLSQLQMTPDELEEADKKTIELRIREIELEENLQRKDFSDAEQVALTKKIHDLKVEIYGKAYKGQTHGKTDVAQKGWSIRDTANLVGRGREVVRQDIALAQDAEEDPEIAAALEISKMEAKRLQKKKKRDAERAEIRQETIKTLKETSKSGTKAEALAMVAESLQLGNAFDLIKDFEDGSFDFIELDPPWGIPLVESYEDSQRRNKSQSADIGSEFQDIPADEYVKKMRVMLKECYRVAAPKSWLILWYGIRDMHEVNRKLLEDAGFKIAGAPGLWTKNLASGWNRVADYTLTTDYEPFWIAKKGGALVNDVGASAIFPFKRVAGTSKIHQTEKPVELYTAIINTLAGENPRVLSPFAGSGNALWAAYALGGFGRGFEMTETYRDAFIARVAEMLKHPTDWIHHSYDGKTAEGHWDNGFLYTQPHTHKYKKLYVWDS